MALRTPRVDGLTIPPNAVATPDDPAAHIEELQAHLFWGRYEVAADLPNATNNAASAPAYDLMRPGDLACAGEWAEVYQLITRGTSGGSDAVWEVAGSSYARRATYSIGV